MSRFEMTELDRNTVDRARQVLADVKSLNLLDAIAVAEMLGRLEVTVEVLVEMVDRAVSE